MFSYRRLTIIPINAASYVDCWNCTYDYYEHCCKFVRTRGKKTKSTKWQEIFCMKYTSPHSEIPSIATKTRGPEVRCLPR